MSTNNLMPKITLFFAVLLLFGLVAVFGVFALALLSQSVAFMFQSGTILLIQCTSAIVILALVGLLGSFFWQQQKLQAMLFSAMQNNISSSQLPTQNRQPVAFLPVDTQDEMADFLLDQPPAELPQSFDAWLGRAPWEY